MTRAIVRDHYCNSAAHNIRHLVAERMMPFMSDGGIGAAIVKANGLAIRSALQPLRGKQE